MVQFPLLCYLFNVYRVHCDKFDVQQSVHYIFNFPYFNDNAYFFYNTYIVNNVYVQQFLLSAML